jgi:hypothetical protein
MGTVASSKDSPRISLGVVPAGGAIWWSLAAVVFA